MILGDTSWLFSLKSGEKLEEQRIFTTVSACLTERQVLTHGFIAKQRFESFYLRICLKGNTTGDSLPSFPTAATPK